MTFTVDGTEQARRYALIADYEAEKRHYLQMDERRIIPGNETISGDDEPVSMVLEQIIAIIAALHAGAPIEQYEY